MLISVLPHGNLLNEQQENSSSLSQRLLHPQARGQCILMMQLAPMKEWAMDARSAFLLCLQNAPQAINILTTITSGVFAWGRRQASVQWMQILIGERSSYILHLSELVVLVFTMRGERVWLMQGSGSDLIQPVLDNQLKASSPLVLPQEVGCRIWNTLPLWRSCKILRNFAEYPSCGSWSASSLSGVGTQEKGDLIHRHWQKATWICRIGWVRCHWKRLWILWSQHLSQQAKETFTRYAHALP